MQCRHSMGYIQALGLVRSVPALKKCEVATIMTNANNTHPFCLLGLYHSKQTFSDMSPKSTAPAQTYK